MPLLEKLGRGYLHKVMYDEGVIHKNARRVAEVYPGKEKVGYLFHMGSTHHFEHVGQIMFIRKLLGYTDTR